MDPNSLTFIFLNAALINNFVLALFLGLCPFLGVSAKKETAWNMGLATTFVMLVSSVSAYAINWLVFIPSNAAKTEKYYDLTGSITYISVTLIAVVLGVPLGVLAALLLAGTITGAFFRGQQRLTGETRKEKQQNKQAFHHQYTPLRYELKSR